MLWRVGLVCGLGVVVFGATLDAYFTSDDFERIWYAAQGGSSGGFRSWGNNLRPLTVASIRLNHAAGGLDPLPYHLTNLGLHLLNSGLVGVLAMTLARPHLRREDPRVAALGTIAASVFVVSPVHVEAVSWISGRADLLMTCWALVALVAWLRRPSGARAWYAGAVLAFVLALASKESAIVVPALVVLAELSRGGEWTFRRLAEVVHATWAFHVVAVAYVVVRLSVGIDGGGYELADVIGSPVRSAARAAALVVRSVVPGLPPFGWLVVAGAVVAVVVAVVVALLRGAPRAPTGRVLHRVLPVSLLAVALSVVPVAGLGVSLTTTQGERLVYLPSVVAAIAVAGVLVAVRSVHRRTGTALVVVLVLGSVATTVVLNQRWADAGELSERLVAAESTWDVDTDVVLLNLPDSVRGAYVGRNALAASLASVHGWTSTHRAREVLVFDAGGPDVRVEVLPAPGPRTWEIRLLDEEASFDAPRGAVASEVAGVEVVRVDARRALVSLAPEVDASTVWYYSDGEMRRVPR